MSNHTSFQWLHYDTWSKNLHFEHRLRLRLCPIQSNRKFNCTTHVHCMVFWALFVNGQILFHENCTNHALVILPYYSDNKLTFQRFAYMDWKNDQSFTSNLTLKQLSIILRFITQIDLRWIESPISYCAIFWTIWYLKISLQ